MRTSFSIRNIDTLGVLCVSIDSICSMSIWEHGILELECQRVSGLLSYETE